MTIKSESGVELLYSDTRILLKVCYEEIAAWHLHKNIIIVRTASYSY